MENKIVLITGAGFSAPAKLPIQDRILNEMIERQSDDFLSMNSIESSRKFLVAYIKVTIYLLKEYGNCNVKDQENALRDMEMNYYSGKRISELLNYVQENYDEDAKEKEFNLRNMLDDIEEKYIIDEYSYRNELEKLKEQLRKLLEENKIKISLEDIFTSFDKSIAIRENTQKYTYSEMDELQHYILRLFIYYFCKKTNEHNYKNQNYDEVIKFLSKNNNHISVITTNWDVLFEKYMIKHNLKYSYEFNSKYVYNVGSTEDVDDVDCINILKIHGSINWFRCLRCGTLRIYDVNECGQYLFDDEKEERCEKCNKVAYGSQIQLKPEIITPTMLKSINNQLYSNLWQNAAYELQEATKIIFCGYSLPIADFEFRYMLKQNIKEGTKIDIILHKNDDPINTDNETLKGLLPERRYKDLFSKQKCNFYYEGFEEYFKQENSIL